MNFLKIIGAGINATSQGISYLGEGLNVINNELEKFNEEQQLRDPFRKIRRKSQEIKHVINMAGIIIPDFYINTHKVIGNSIEIADIIINLMNATIDTPAQRDQILHIIYKTEIEMEMEYKAARAKWKLLMEELYSKGLDKNSSTADMVHFILDQEEDGELEKTMLELLPDSTLSLQKVKTIKMNLQKKGFVTY